MKTLKHFLKVQLTLLVLMLCSSMPAFGEDNSVVVQIDGIFYRLYQQEMPTGTDYYASVTYNPEIDPWMGGNSDGRYKGDLVIPETVRYNDQDYPVRYCEWTAYLYAHNMTSISFPKTITNIDGASYLGELNNLEAIIVDSDNPNYTTIDGVLYNKEVTDVLVFPCKRGGTYRVPATITEFGQNGLSIGKPILDELIIPATVTKIGNSVFSSSNSSQIKKVTIEDSENQLTVGSGNGGPGFYDENNYVSINPLFYQCGIQEVYWGRNLKGNPPFAGNGTLTKVTFGPKVTSVPKYSFYDCSVNTVNLLGGLEQWMGFDFTKNYTNPLWNHPNGTALFNGSTLYGNVDIPASITSIPSHAFQYSCEAVTSLNIHANVSDIADGAFRGLKNLQNINLDSDNPYFILDENVLYNKEVTKIYFYPQLKPGDFTVPATVTELGDYLFSNCSKLTAITIPASVATIGNGAFNNCPSLTNVVIEDGTTPLTLGYGYKVIQNGTYTDTYWGGQFFGAAVTNAYIGRNLIINGQSPFASDLTTVTIGDKVNQFPEDTFKNCSGILNVYFDGTIIDWCNITFANQYATPFGNTIVDMSMYSSTMPSSMLTGNVSPILHVKEGPLHSQVNVPSPATKIGAYAFFGQLGVSTVTIPATIQTIEPYAFFGVEDVYFETTSVVPLQNKNSFSGNIYVPDDLLLSYRQASVWSDLSDRIYPLGFLQVTVDLIAMGDTPALLPALNALEKINGEYRIERLTNLKIRGTMNGYDILMIRTKMPNLRRLDLSEATILDNDGDPACQHQDHPILGLCTVRHYSHGDTFHGKYDW